MTVRLHRAVEAFLQKLEMPRVIPLPPQEPDLTP
jgi:hypothetical protein